MLTGQLYFPFWLANVLPGSFLCFIVGLFRQEQTKATCYCTQFMGEARRPKYRDIGQEKKSEFRNLGKTNEKIGVNREK